MDYYQVLRVGVNASRKEIEQAYQKLLKEARYDTSIDRMLVENAYRTLTDTASKSRYDARQTLKTKRVERSRKKKPLSLGALPVFGWITKLTLPQLLTILAITFTITAIFYFVRFGYLLKDFQAGDMLYDTITDQPFGKILRVESDYQFRKKREDAYQIELSPHARHTKMSPRVVWLPKDSVRIRCYKKD